MILTHKADVIMNQIDKMVIRIAPEQKREYRTAIMAALMKIDKAEDEETAKNKRKTAFHPTDQDQMKGRV